MTLDQVPSGTRIVVDANILVYHFQPDPKLGPMCQRLIERIERHDITGITFASLLAETTHRLMLIEASSLPGWAGGKVLNRLKQQPGVIKHLTLFQTAIDTVLQSKLVVLPVAGALVSAATSISRQFNLLTNDALIVALMQLHGLNDLASADADLDAIPGITRYAPA